MSIYKYEPRWHNHGTVWILHAYTHGSSTCPFTHLTHTVQHAKGILIYLLSKRMHLTLFPGDGIMENVCKRTIHEYCNMLQLCFPFTVKSAMKDWPSMRDYFGRNVRGPTYLYILPLINNHLSFKVYFGGPLGVLFTFTVLTYGSFYII